MKNHEFMPDILVSPIFSQLSKREEKKLFKGVQTLSYNKCKFYFCLFSSQKFMHCQIIKELIPFLSKSFMNPILENILHLRIQKFIPGRVRGIICLLFQGGGGPRSVFGKFRKNYPDPDPIQIHSCMVFIRLAMVRCTDDDSHSMKPKVNNLFQNYTFQIYSCCVN